MRVIGMRYPLIALLTAITAAAALSGAKPHAARVHDDDSEVVQTNLVADTPGIAAVTDPDMVNPWGISHSSGSPFWVSDNGTGLSTLYNSAGTKLGLIVTIPPPAGGTGPSAPTGNIFNGTTSFTVAPGKPAAFIFATEDGTISGWNPGVNPTNAVLTVDNSANGAVYKGLAMGSVGSANFLYVTNFRSGEIEVYDTNFARVNTPHKFVDEHIRRGYAPFNIENINGWLFVTYAVQNAEKHDDVGGQGHGYVDVYDTSGNLVKRLIRHGRLNSPWGMTMAPATFGKFAGKLLVGNFGDGHINAYDVDLTKGDDGDTENTVELRYTNHKPVTIDGLWSLIVGNGGSGGDAGKVYFTAGPDGETHGLIGSLELAP